MLAPSSINKKKERQKAIWESNHYEKSKPLLQNANIVA